ncbi:MAG: nicotinate-nucleotide adenylyltransferase [Aggregatilineales bacterium]
MNAVGSRSIGVLGGTFDPPHIGHLILGEYAVEALNLDCLLYVPAADPPHKRNREKAAVEHRLAMLQLALAGNDHFCLSRIDIDRPGPHFSLEMVRIVQSHYPGAALYFVMGGDSLRDLPAWHRPEELIELCQFAVMERPGDTIDPHMHDSVLPGLAQRVVILRTPALEISSTEIVNRLREGRSVRYLVPDSVLAYIAQNGLYRS